MSAPRDTDLSADLRTLRRMLPQIVGANTAEMWMAFGRIEKALGHGIYAAPAPRETAAAPALDVAWRAVEAALPAGWSFYGLTAFMGDRWHAMAFGPRPEGGPCPCCGQARHDQRASVSEYDATPAAALNALAARLSAAGDADR